MAKFYIRSGNSTLGLIRISAKELLRVPKLD
jgi:hypothetical protein